MQKKEEKNNSVNKNIYLNCINTMKSDIICLQIYKRKTQKRKFVERKKQKLN